MWGQHVLYSQYFNFPVVHGSAQFDFIIPNGLRYVNRSLINAGVRYINKIYISAELVHNNI